MARRTAMQVIFSVLLLLAAASTGQGAGAPAASTGSAASKPAASPGTRAPVSEEARDALRKAIVFHRRAKDLAFKFSAEVYNADLDKRDRYQGRLLLKDSTRFRLEIPGGTYVSDGTTFWEYHPKNKQVTVRSAADMGDQPLPGDVLLRFLDSEPLSVAKTRLEGKEYLELRLDPSRAMKNLDSLAVLLDRRNHSLRRIVSRDASGNEARYTLLSVKRDGGVKDREFAFEPPKGVEVVDMR